MQPLNSTSIQHGLELVGFQYKTDGKRKQTERIQIVGNIRVLVLILLEMKLVILVLRSDLRNQSCCAPSVLISIFYRVYAIRLKYILIHST